jgi:hypothetical protein
MDSASGEGFSHWRVIGLHQVGDEPAMASVRANALRSSSEPREAIDGIGKNGRMTAMTSEPNR